MTKPDIIQSILKDSNYHLSLFTEDEIDAMREKTFTKKNKSKEVVFVKCIVRDKEIQLKPEEVVRQLSATRLVRQYDYPKKRLAFECKVNFGREKKNVDINTLDFERWNDKTEKDKKWIGTYGKGFGRLEKLRVEKGENKLFKFDILMANPPFAGDIKESRILHQYEPGFKSTGKDNSGDYIYVKNENGQYRLDKNGHLIVDHDLHNHNGEMPDGIAEAFIEWAKKEKLSFWN